MTSEEKQKLIDMSVQLKTSMANLSKARLAMGEEEQFCADVGYAHAKAEAFVTALDEMISSMEPLEKRMARNEAA